MKTTPPPPEQNAATYYLRLDQWMRQHPYVYQRNEPAEGGLMGRLRPDATVQAAGRKRMTHFAEALKLIHTAASLPRADFQKNWALGPAILFPEYARMRGATRLLTDESALFLWDGKPLVAVQAIGQGFAIASHADSGGTLIAHLVAVAIDAITLRGLENILYQAGDQPGVAAAVRQAIERSFTVPSLAHAMRGELVMDLVSFDMVRKGGPQAFQQVMSTAPPAQPASTLAAMTPEQRRKFYEKMDADTAALVHCIRKAYLAADGPYPTAKKVFHEVTSWAETNKRRYELFDVVSPVYDQSAAKHTLIAARAAAIRSAAAVLEWKAKHGALPEHLKDVLPSPPTDPFDLKPLRYRRLGNSFLVWSVGEKGKFGGISASASDYRLQAIFRWPMAEVLKKKAAPPRPAPGTTASGAAR
jgi:hypothetical protein